MRSGETVVDNSYIIGVKGTAPSLGQRYAAGYRSTPKRENRAAATMATKGQTTILLL